MFVTVSCTFTVAGPAGIVAVVFVALLSASVAGAPALDLFPVVRERLFSGSVEAVPSSGTVERESTFRVAALAFAVGGPSITIVNVCEAEGATPFVAGEGERVRSDRRCCSRNHPVGSDGQPRRQPSG